MFPKIPDARTYDKTPQFQWVRLKNTGAQAIPPWSICEVTSPTLDLAGPDSPPFEGGMTFNARQPTSYLAYQLASSGPFAIQPGDYGPGLHGSILATNESAAADVRAMPTKNSFGLYIGKGGPLVSTGQMAQGVTLWHYDPAGMDGYFLCASATAAATPPGENESCDATTLVAGTGALLVTDGGSFVELPETVSFHNVLAVAIADGTVVFVHRSANGEFHTVGLGKKNCPPFLGTADDDITAGGTGTVTKQPCGDGSPASESVPDVKNRGGDPIRRYCRVLVIPCSDECDYEAISLNCPDEECDFTGSVYTVGSLFAGLADGGVELNWQYQTERYQKGKLCTVTSGPVLTTTIPTWHCCYPPVCDDIFYKEVDCSDIYVAFYATSGLTPPVGGTNLGTATIEINGDPTAATMFGFCDIPSGTPLHHDNGPSVPCAIDKIARANNGVNVYNISYAEDGDNFNCCPSANEVQGEFEVAYIPAECYPDPTDSRKIVIAKCHSTPPGTPWTSNFPSRARRTTARDPNCCEGVDDPDPCCCPDEFDAGVYFSAKSTHTHNDGTQELTKEFFIPYDLIDSSFGVGSISGTRPSFEQFTVPVWVEKNGELVQATLEVEIDLRCENGVWSGEVNIPKTWDAVLCKPGASEEYTLSNDLCCFQQLDIPPTAILEGVDPGYDKGNPYAAPNNSLEIAIGCPVNLSCQYDDVCDRIYTAALRHPSGGGKYGCCCPPCACPGGDIGDITIGGEALTLYCNECVTKPTYSGSVDIDIVFENTNNPAITVTQTYRFTASYHCEQGVWTGGISVTNLDDDEGGACDVTHQVYTTNNECSLDSEEKNGALDSSIIPAESLHAELPNDLRGLYTTDDLTVNFDGITATGPCEGPPQWKYCDTEATIDFTPPSGRWKYAGYSSQKDAHVYLLCAGRDRATCEDVAATWFADETVAEFTNLGVHRLPLDYWQLDSVAPAAQNVADSCCDCEPWSEVGAVPPVGVTEICCPEAGDEWKVEVALSGAGPVAPITFFMEIGETLPFAIPIEITTSTITNDENRTNREEDSGVGSQKEVYIYGEISLHCEEGEAWVDVYLKKFEGECDSCQGAFEFLGSFPIDDSIVIKKKIVREAISCAWLQDMFPCCDPADWEPTEASITISKSDPDPICTRPECPKIVTAGLVPTDPKKLKDKLTGCCCGTISVNEFMFLDDFGFADGTHGTLASFGNFVVRIPFFSMNSPNVSYDIATGGVAEAPRPECGPGQSWRGAARLDISNKSPDCVFSDFFFIPMVPPSGSPCESPGLQIFGNTIWHLGGPPEDGVHFYVGSYPGNPVGVHPSESCVSLASGWYGFTYPTEEGDCLECIDIPEDHDFGPWVFAGHSQLKQACVFATCCIEKYNALTQQCECNAPELPDPPAGWEWGEIKAEPLEWWGIEGADEAALCCACECDSFSSFDVTVQYDDGPTETFTATGGNGFWTTGPVGTYQTHTDFTQVDIHCDPEEKFRADVWSFISNPNGLVVGSAIGCPNDCLEPPFTDIIDGVKIALVGIKGNP